MFSVFEPTQRVSFLTLTASKLIKESTATVAALLSALLASRRNCVLFVRNKKHDTSRLTTRADLHEVVLTVNHVYATIVTAVIAAKSHPNLYVYKSVYNTKKKKKTLKIERTKIPHTIEISKAVGTIRNMIDCRRNVIPLEYQRFSVSEIWSNKNLTWFRDQ